MVTCTWKKGSEGLFHGANAQAVADEIASIGDEVTPSEIVDKARNEDTELHKCFEWDDEIAAEKFRLQQARVVINHLVFTPIEDKSEEPKEVRTFFRTESTQGTGYKQTVHIMSNMDEYAKLLETAKRELRAFKAKYQMLVELKDIFDLID